MKKSVFVLLGLFSYQFTVLGMEGRHELSYSNSSQNFKAVQNELFSGPVPGTSKNSSRDFDFMEESEQEESIEGGFPAPGISRNSSSSAFVDPTSGNVTPWNDQEFSSDKGSAPKTEDDMRIWLNQRSNVTESTLIKQLGSGRIKTAFTKGTNRWLVSRNREVCLSNRQISDQLVDADTALRESVNQFVQYLGPNFARSYYNAGSLSDRVKLVGTGALQCLKKNTEDIARMQEDSRRMQENMVFMEEKTERMQEDIEKLKEQVSLLTIENERLRNGKSHLLENSPTKNNPNNLLENHPSSSENKLENHSNLPEEETKEESEVGAFEINSYFKYEGKVSDKGANGKGTVSHKNGILKIEGIFCNNILDLEHEIDITGGIYGSECKFKGTKDKSLEISLEDIAKVRKAIGENGSIYVWSNGNYEGNGIAFNPDFIYKGPLKRNGTMSEDGIKVLAGKSKPMFKFLETK